MCRDWSACVRRKSFFESGEKFLPALRRRVERHEREAAAFADQRHWRKPAYFSGEQTRVAESGGDVGKRMLVVLGGPHRIVPRLDELPRIVLAADAFGL